MANKIGRNDRCPCGSGKKYKRCHIDAPAISSVAEKKDNVKKIVGLLAKTMKVEFGSPCFCGSGEVFEKCCGSGSKDNLLFLENAFDVAEAYTVSQGGKIKSIPLGIWKKFEKTTLDRFTCVYPGCSQKPISSHLVPENILRSNFGTYCKEYRMSDNAMVMQFAKTGVGKAGSLPVFCSKHDNDIFREIDTLEIDFSSKRQLFLFALKAIAFSSRRVQYLLSMDSQLEIVRPFWIAKNPNRPAGNHFEINIDTLHEQYIRFITNEDFLKKAMEIYANKNWDSFAYFHRSIPYVKPIFFGGFLNPSHDLEGKKLNTSETAIATSCNLFTKDNFLHVVLGCPDGKSKTSYEGLLKQLASADEEIFITVINNFITVSADKPLLPETTSFSDSELVKIQNLQKFAGECLKSKDKIFDLKDASQAIRFI
jgi:hypothetical protein